jgi:hypothetical protein
MLGETASEFSLEQVPRWPRIIAGSILLAVAFLLALDFGVAQLRWLTPLSFSLILFLGTFRSKSESFGAYLRRPRAILTLVLMLTLTAGGAHDIFRVLVKYVK